MFTLQDIYFIFKIMSHFVLMFWRDKPVDWLLDDLMNSKNEKRNMKQSIQPDQFQHIGHFSSLKGKIQMVQDNSKSVKNTSTLKISLIIFLLSMLLFIFMILLLNVLTSSR